MRSDRTQKIVWAGLFTALTVVATMVIRYPTANGYVNVGDSLVILSAFLLGPTWGAIAAGLGSALADILSGYIIYSPATLIIKGLMALAAGAILISAKKKNDPRFAILASIVAEIIMVSGYFAYELIIYGIAASVVDIIPNCIQGAVNAVVGTILFYALLRIPYVKKTF